MNVLFVHKNFPAQFRYIMPYLVNKREADCTFVSAKRATTVSSKIRQLQYKPRFQATKFSSYCGRSFENQMWHSQAIVEALAAQPNLRPDLVVAHAGFFTTAFLRELYDCPIVNMFEYYYHSTQSDYDFRSDLFDSALIERIRARARNSVFLLDLENCDAGYCPTRWQRGRFPDEYQDKLAVSHDGVDTQYWCPADTKSSDQHDDRFDIPAGTKVVTYVTRGFESMRGFDIFMRFAKRICDLRDDVIFLVAGSDRVSYGADKQITEGKSFKDWVLMQDDYDLERIRFLGYVPQETVRAMYRRSDLHVYLTAPFVVSWSPLDAMSTGALVMASDTAPVREVIDHCENGLLVDFFDVDQMVARATEVFDSLQLFADVRQRARIRMEKEFGLDVAMPRLANVLLNASVSC